MINIYTSCAQFVDYAGGDCLIMHHNGDNALFDVGEGRGRGENGILRRVSVSRQTESAMQLNGRVSRTSTTPATPVTAADINERLCVCVCVCGVSGIEAFLL